MGILEPLIGIFELDISQELVTEDDLVILPSNWGILYRDDEDRKEEFS